MTSGGSLEKNNEHQTKVTSISAVVLLEADVVVIQVMVSALKKGLMTQNK